MAYDRSFQEMMERYNRELMSYQKRGKPKWENSNTPPLSTPPSTTPVAEKVEVLVEEAQEHPEPIIEDRAKVCIVAEEKKEEEIKALPCEETPLETCAEDRPEYHTQTVGANGVALLQDLRLHETLENFVYHKDLERVVHTKGYGAFGYFQPYQSMKQYTKAGFLQDSTKRIPVFVRFSLAVSNLGTPDTSRNVRGFAVKFYTEDGNLDIVGNHIPIFFIRDAIRFPEVIAALSPSPVNNLNEPCKIWEFIARTPESTAMLTWLYSDVGTLDSFCHMRGYGVNTFVWRNCEGTRTYVKYHWIPKAGERYLDRKTAQELACKDPDIAGRQLYQMLEKGDSIEYELCVQLMPQKDAENLSFDPLDDTKVWSEVSYPLYPVGKMTLNQNPTNYREQVEQSAFSPANLVDGIELSADKMLQGRSFIYWDAQRRRLGKNFRDLPINQTKNQKWNMPVDSGDGECISGCITRSTITKPDDFTQAGERYRSLSATQQEHLVDNIASELYAAPDKTQKCVLSYLMKADQNLGTQLQSQIQYYKNK